VDRVERGEGVERAAVDLAEGGGAVAGQRRNGVGRGYFGSGTRVSAFEDALDGQRLEAPEVLRA
jgi:hypothetical protein